MNFFDLIFKGEVGHSTRMGWWENILGEFIGGVAKLIAKFLKIKGNTIVWNQLIQNGNFASADGWGSNDGLTFSASNNILTATVTGTVGGSTQIRRLDAPLKKGHTYFVSVDANPSKAVSFRFCYPAIADPSTVKQMPQGTWTNYSIVSKMTDDSAINYLYVNVTGSLASNDTIQLKNYIMVDLTQMFGAGKEPSTAEEFTNLFPLPYYQFEQGKLLSFNGTGIKTVGFNQWDEEWELGRLVYDKTDPNFGENYSSSTAIRSKNFISALPSTGYFGVAQKGFVVFFYDGNEKAIPSYGNSGYQSITAVTGTSFTTPSNCHYLKFYMNSTTTYGNDICINISDADKNGTYEPYTSSTSSLPISEYFPTGMKSAGSVYDELTNSKAITRIGTLDLGQLAWIRWEDGANVEFYAFYTSGIKVDSNSIPVCERYLGVSVASDNYNAYSKGDKTICFRYPTFDRIYIRDDSFSDADALKTSLNGVMLYYELATPIEVDIDPPLNLSYQVWEGGTEQLLPVNTDNPTTSPILADIKYPDGERDDQYFTYRQYLPNSQLLGMALNTLMGRSVPFNQEALDILMKGE